MFLIRTKPSPVFVFIIAIALIFVFGAVNFSHFFKLYTVAAISSILLAAFIPLAFNQQQLRADDFQVPPHR